ncbi:MAG: M48 family metalloprotease [Planctomycetes bacterium]|nr:M48 family metalloprotease [Planctomycetota bacterium]
MKRLILLSAFLALLFGCTALQKALKAKGLDKQAAGVGVIQNVVAVATPFSIDEEVEIGRAMAARMIALSGGIYPDEKLNHYLNLVGRTAALTVGREDLPADMYQFAVLNSEEINAFAVPGGYVFITFGSLKIIRSEAELAAVLAHEIAHVDKRHLLDAIKAGYKMDLLSDAATLLQKGDNEGLNKVLSSTSDFGVGTLLKNGLSRECEAEADHQAVKFLVNTGYPSGVLVDFLGKINEKTAQNDAGTKQLSATHPDMASRIKAINDFIAQKQFNPDAGQLDAERFNEYAKGIK